MLSLRADLALAVSWTLTDGCVGVKAVGENRTLLKCIGYSFNVEGSLGVGSSALQPERARRSTSEMSLLVALTADAKGLLDRP